MHKKSQIQMGETIAVLFVFFILVIIGFIFYVKVIKSNAEVQSEESSQLNSVDISQKVMFLPELQCSEGNRIADNCIDILKINSAQNVIRDNALYYYDLLEFGNISVSQIYPSEAQWTIYSRKNPEYQNRFVTNVPISLLDPVTRKQGFGVLTIETLSK